MLKKSGGSRGYRGGRRLIGVLSNRRQYLKNPNIASSKITIYCDLEIDVGVERSENGKEKVCR